MRAEVLNLAEDELDGEFLETSLALERLAGRGGRHTGRFEGVGNSLRLTVGTS